MAPPLPEGAERASRKRITDRVYMMSWMSIIPALVAYRQSIECVAVGLPLRHALIHQRHKALVVRGFEQVKHRHREADRLGGLEVDDELELAVLDPMQGRA
jgi:hypothetical protein